jgi:hypothetical protein
MVVRISMWSMVTFMLGACVGVVYGAGGFIFYCVGVVFWCCWAGCWFGLLVGVFGFFWFVVWMVHPTVELLSNVGAFFCTFV